MRSDSELLMLIFRSVKGWAWLLCCSILQNPTEHKLIREPDGPRRQILAQNPTTRPIRLSNKKMASVFNQEKNLTEQSRPGTTAVRGTHKSTSSDRYVGPRTQPRCANAVAAPRRSQTTASCRWTRPRTYLEKEGEQHTQRASFVATYHTRVQTRAASRSGRGCFVEKKYHVKRLGTSLCGQTRV